MLLKHHIIYQRDDNILEWFTIINNIRQIFKISLFQCDLYKMEKYFDFNYRK